MMIAEFDAKLTDCFHKKLYVADQIAQINPNGNTFLDLQDLLALAGTTCFLLGRLFNRYARFV